MSEIKPTQLRGTYWCCEKCHYAHDQDYCPECGHNSKVREEFPARTDHEIDPNTTFGSVIEGINTSRFAIAASEALTIEKRREINGPLLDAILFIRAVTRIVLTPPKELERGPEMHEAYCPALSGGECECGFKKAVLVDWDGVQEVLDGVWRREMSADDGFDQLNELISTTPPQCKPMTDESAHQILLDMAEHIEAFGDETTTEQQFSAECIRFIFEQVAVHNIKGNA